MKTPFKYQRSLGLLLASGITGLVLSLGGCVYDPYYYGPPPHTHFYPGPYDYYFYPSSGVYFHFTTGLYWYLDGGVWISSTILPPHIHITARERVHIRVESKKPWVKYKEHDRSYDYRKDRKTRPDAKDSKKERDANRRWYDEYRQKRDDRDSKDRKETPFERKPSRQDRPFR